MLMLMHILMLMLQMCDHNQNVTMLAMIPMLTMISMVINLRRVL